MLVDIIKSHYISYLIKTFYNIIKEDNKIIKILSDDLNDFNYKLNEEELNITQLIPHYDKLYPQYIYDIEDNQVFLPLNCKNCNKIIGVYNKTVYYNIINSNEIWLFVNNIKIREKIELLNHYKEYANNMNISLFDNCWESVFYKYILEL